MGGLNALLGGHPEGVTLYVFVAGVISPIGYPAEAL
jgi:hypothetical protein